MIANSAVVQEPALAPLQIGIAGPVLSSGSGGSLLMTTYWVEATKRDATITEMKDFIIIIIINNMISNL